MHKRGRAREQQREKFLEHANNKFYLIFSRANMLPLVMLPPAIECELAVVSEAFAGVANDWTVTRPRLVADCCDLDQTLQNSYASHQHSGKSLPIYMQSLY